MNKPCVKCESLDRKTNGDCRPCAIARDRAYKESHRKELAEQSKVYYHAHKEQLAKTSAEWRRKNAEYLTKKGAEYRAANPEKMAEHKRKHYEKNTAKIKKRAADWVKNNIEYVRIREKQYRKNNPELFVNYKAIRRTRVGSDKLPYGTISKLFKTQNGLCACCNTPLDKYHVDHIMPLALGGRNVPENVQLLSPKCNQTKSAKHPDVWKAEIAARHIPVISSIGSHSCESSSFA